MQEWLALNQEKIDRWLQAIQHLYNTDTHDFAMLSVINQELATLARSAVSLNDHQAARE